MAEGRPPALIPSSHPAQCRDFDTRHPTRLMAYAGAAPCHDVAVPLYFQSSRDFTVRLEREFRAAALQRPEDRTVLFEVLTYLNLASRCGCQPTCVHQPTYTT